MPAVLIIARGPLVADVTPHRHLLDFDTVLADSSHPSFCLRLRYLGPRQVRKPFSSSLVTSSLTRLGCGTKPPWSNGSAFRRFSSPKESPTPRVRLEPLQLHLFSATYTHLHARLEVWYPQREWNPSLRLEGVPQRLS